MWTVLEPMVLGRFRIAFYQYACVKVQKQIFLANWAPIIFVIYLFLALFY